MKKSKLYNTILYTALLGIVLLSCESEFDSPPEQTINPDMVLTIADLREMCPNGENYTFTGDTMIYGVLTSDSRSGNIYKKHYIQDKEQAVELRLTATSRLVEGDSVRVNLKGSTLNYYNNQFQVDKLNTDNLIVQASGHFVEPITVTIAELQTSTFSTEYQSKLIRLEEVQFLSSELNKTYADAANQKDENRLLQDRNGHQILVRTSGFASFAGTYVAQGSGTIIAIVTQFRDDRQLVIRKLSEVQLDGERF